MRRNVQSSERASDLASIVLPTPGTSSISRCPSQRRVTRQSRISSSLLTMARLKFEVIDSVGRPVYCDPDFNPIARAGGEQANAISTYPQIKADAEVYAAIVAHEHLPPGDLAADAQKLIVYRAWNLLRAPVLTE